MCIIVVPLLTFLWNNIFLFIHVHTIVNLPMSHSSALCPLVSVWTASCVCTCVYQFLFILCLSNLAQLSMSQFAAFRCNPHCMHCVHCCCSCCYVSFCTFEGPLQCDLGWGAVKASVPKAVAYSPSGSSVHLKYCPVFVMLLSLWFFSKQF